LFTKAGIPLPIIDAYSIEINPLEVPEGVNPNLFAPNVADALVRTLKPPPTASKILHQSLHCLYQRHGMFDGNIINYGIEENETLLILPFSEAIKRVLNKIPLSISP